MGEPIAATEPGNDTSLVIPVTAAPSAPSHDTVVDSLLTSASLTARFIAPTTSAVAASAPTTTYASKTPSSARNVG